MDIHRGSVAVLHHDRRRRDTVHLGHGRSSRASRSRPLQPGNINFLNGMEIAHSSYLDFTGYRVTDDTTVEMAYQLDAANVRPATERRHQRRDRARSRAGPDRPAGRGLGIAAAGAGRSSMTAARCGAPTAPTRRSSTPSSSELREYLQSHGARRDQLGGRRQLRHLGRSRARSGSRSTRRRSFRACSARRSTSTTHPTTSSCSGTAISRCRRNGTSRACGSTPRTPAGVEPRARRVGHPAAGRTERRQRLGAGSRSWRRRTSPRSTISRWMGQRWRPGTIGLIEPGIGSALRARAGRELPGNCSRTICQRSARAAPARSTSRAPTASRTATDAGERSLDVGVVSADQSQQQHRPL